MVQEGFSRDANEHPVFARRYGYDASDVLKILEDMHQGLKLYQYDACDRLVAVDGMNPEHFVVDPAGNILGASSERNPGIGEARGDRLLSFNGRKLSYDEHGNRVHESDPKSGVEIANRYDAQNQLVEVTKTDKHGVHVSRFGYDALGRRTWKESLGGSRLEDVKEVLDGEECSAGEIRTWITALRRARKQVDFLWNGNVLLGESDVEADPLKVVYLFEPGTFRPVAQVRRDAPKLRAETYHYHLDHLGTPKEMTDDRGEVVWAADLKAWGTVRVKFASKVENPFRFQGQYHDEETGLHYNRFRYYSPDEGCFINQDPLRLFGSANLAAYAPSPTLWIDPFGLVDLSGTDPTGRPLSSPNYSVWNQVELPPDLAQPGVSRGQHFQYGNQQLYNQIQGDPQFGQMLPQDVVDHVQPGARGAFSRESPPGMTWHHNEQNPNLLELVPRDQHRAPGPVQESLHPDQGGGFKKLQNGCPV